MHGMMIKNLVDYSEQNKAMNTTLNNVTRQIFGDFANELPYWYDEAIHNQVLFFLIKEEKLQACKHLITISKQHNTYNIFGLTWAKNEICDNIENLSKRLIFEKDSQDIALLDFTFNSSLVERVAIILHSSESLSELTNMLKYVPTKVLEEYLKEKEYLEKV